MKKLIFTIFAVSFLLGLNTSDVSACSCIVNRHQSRSEQVKGALKNSTAVFVGEVVEIIKKPDVYFIEIRFKVEKTWGIEFQKEFSVTTGQGGGDCGYRFEVGEKYLVYAHGDKSKLETNICTRTASIEGNDDIGVLNKIKKSKIKSSPK